MKRLIFVVMAVSLMCTFCDSDSKPKGDATVVTYQYLMERGFREFPNNPYVYTTDKIKCSEIKRKLGFDWDDLEYSPSMWADQWYINIGNREFQFTLEQKKLEKNEKDYLLKHPEAICYATVSLL